MAKMTLQMHPDTVDTTVVAPMPTPNQGGQPPSPNPFAAPPLGTQPTQPILGKFKTQADLEAAYVALERKMGMAPPAPTPPAGEPPVVTTTGTPSTPGALSDADMTRYGNEVMSSGDLSAESMTEILQKTGLPRATVEAHVKLMKKDAEVKQAQFLAEAGGQDQLTLMVQWAGQGGLDATEAAEYDAALQSGDEARTKLAIRYLRAKYQASNTVEPNQTLGGRGPSVPAVPAFESWDQVTTAMEDKRYKDDPAFRNWVDTRLNASQNIQY